MRNTVKIKGINELSLKLKKNANMNEVKAIVKTNGAEMNNKAQIKAPVDTGFLRRSIIFELADAGFTSKVKALAEYAPYLEHGTRFMPAQPFIGPAYRVQKQQFKNDLQKLVE